MDYVWIVLGGVLLLVGILGCFLPVLPGPPLAYLGLLIQQLKSSSPFSTRILIVFLLITIGITVLDYIIPVYGTKKFGGSTFGVWGSTIGLLIGLFFVPMGIIAGPFIGALIGELIATSDPAQALKAATGSFIGFLAGTFLKLVVCLVMAWYWITSWIG
jgi:uncharacterized protein YqgC (DUF456 family)